MAEMLPVRHGIVTGALSSGMHIATLRHYPQTDQVHLDQEEMQGREDNDPDRQTSRVALSHSILGADNAVKVM